MNKDFDRISFPDDPDLKPLYANFRRLGLAKYLASESFDQLIVELNFDEDWCACLNECGVNKLSDSLEYEEPFYLLLNIFYAELSLDDTFDIIRSLLIDFAKWNSQAIDIKKVCTSLQELDVYETDLKKLQSQIKKISKTKRENLPLQKTPTRDPKKVFIIHGHDKSARLELEKLLHDEFNLIPVILQDSPNQGFDTIISKFERLSKDCATAIVLLTPDDSVNEGISRARQNTIFELGYFLGRDQQKSDRKIIIIKKGEVEVPSDIHGVLYLKFNDSIKEVYLDLKRQLKEWKIAN